MLTVRRFGFGPFLDKCGLHGLRSAYPPRVAFERGLASAIGFSHVLDPFFRASAKLVVLWALGQQFFQAREAV